jgi:hypothetical protein
MLLLLPLAAIAASAATPVEATVSSASLFKNGMAVVMREIPVSGNGEYLLREMPRASLGTLWIMSSEGVRIESVATATNETNTRIDASTLDEVLQASVGKTLTLHFPNDKTRSGTLVGATGAIVVLDEEGGQMIALPKASIVGVEGELNYMRELKGTQKALRVRVQAQRPGKVYLLGLERGATWAPGYSVELLDNKRLLLTAKATLLNDLEDFNATEVRFITGFPNVPFAQILDPLTSGQSVEEFVSLLGRIGVETRDMARGRAGEMMMAQGPAGMADKMGMEPTGAGGFQAEDLFFYRQPNVRLQKGERAYYVLFRAETTYESVYSWDLPFPVLRPRGMEIPSGPQQTIPADFWHTLRFKNTSGQPLTTAAATTFRNGEIIGQDMLRYTPSGAETVLRVTKAMDIQGEESEEEVARERMALKLPNAVSYDLVTLKGTVRVRNTKNERVKIVLTRELPGEFVDSEGVAPKVTKTTAGLRQMNPFSRLVWETELAPGQETTLGYRYRVYVPSGMG